MLWHRRPEQDRREREQMNEEVSHRAITLPAQLRDEERPDLGSFSRNHLQSALHPVPWLQAACRGGRAHGDTAAACEMQEMAWFDIATCNTARGIRRKGAKCGSTGTVARALLPNSSMSTPAESVPPEQRRRPAQRLKRFLLGGPKTCRTRTSSATSRSSHSSPGSGSAPTGCP